MGIVSRSIAKDKAKIQADNRQKALSALSVQNAPAYSNYDEPWMRKAKADDSMNKIGSGMRQYDMEDKIANGKATPNEIGQYRADQNQDMETEALMYQMNGGLGDEMASNLGSEVNTYNGNELSGEASQYTPQADDSLSGYLINGER